MPDKTFPGFLSGFAHVCKDASERGWHEANGGNLSYRLTSIDLEWLDASRATAGKWHGLKRPVVGLAGEHFLMSASGAYLSNAACDLAKTAGIIELDDDGVAWRAVWGFEGETHPSSELETHLACYETALQAEDGGNRVVYHAHAPHVIALSTLLKPSSRAWTRALWRCMTECIIVFPQGLGVVPWMVPGSPELAAKTRELMSQFEACVWSNHGIMARAASFDEAFGIVETIEKSCGIYLEALAANAGNEPPHLVTNDQLRAICERYDITPNEDFL